MNVCCVTAMVLVKIIVRIHLAVINVRVKICRVLNWRKMVETVKMLVNVLFGMVDVRRDVYRLLEEFIAYVTGDII